MVIDNPGGSCDDDDYHPVKWSLDDDGKTGQSCVDDPVILGGGFWNVHLDLEIDRILSSDDYQIWVALCRVFLPEIFRDGHHLSRTAVSAHL